MLRRVTTFIFSIALGACAIKGMMPAQMQGGRAPVFVATSFGPIEGVDDTAKSGTLYWLGVPFAKPPVGALRWRAPVDPDPWTSTLSTKTFGNACVQNGTAFGPGANNTYDATIITTLNQAVGSEDCLYLNVWRPRGGEVNLPVIVFLYGGSNVAGYTADPMYNGANLAKAANAVVVTANYRLGIFGWLSLAQLKTGNSDDDSGNFGTLDTIKALQWVNRNIGRFGGNAGNVTLMGQSAGATNAWVLMVCSKGRGAELFHRVAALSGGMSLGSNLPAGSFPMLWPAAYYGAQGKALLNNLLIADGKATNQESAAAFVATQTDSQIADYLRAESPTAILTAVRTKLAPAGLGITTPIPDGTVLPADPISAMAAGNYAKVPVLAGNTRDEAKLFAQFLALSPALGGVPGLKVSDAERLTMIFNFNPNATTTLTADSIISPQYLPVDTPTTGYDAKTALLTKIWFIANRDSVLNTLKTQQSNIWYYRFDWAQEPAPWREVRGASHFFDIPFVFGNFGPSSLSNMISSKGSEGGRVALSNAMIASIAAFARTGDPNNSSLGMTWPVWPKTLVFDATLTDKIISVQ